MTKKLKFMFTGLILVSFMVFTALTLPTKPVSAQLSCASGGQTPAAGGSSISNCLDAGACVGADATTCPSKTNAPGTITGIARTVLNILSVLVGVAAVIMIIIGGFKYIISSGDSGNIKSAKDTILYAIVGLIVVALAQVIVKFVLHKAITAR